MTQQPQSHIAHLRRGGTSLLVASAGGEPPQALHWGADLGPLTASETQAWVAALVDEDRDLPNTRRPATLLPQLADGWLGVPGLECERAGAAWAPRLRVTGWRLDERAADAAPRLSVEMRDPQLGLAAALTLELSDAGLARQQVKVTNTADTPLEVRGLTLRWPVPQGASELLDTAGSWGNERHPQRMPLQVGRWVREARAGKPGCDGPLLVVAGVPGFGFERGTVWAAHLGWSGNQVLAASRNHVGAQFLEAGELLLPGEVVLAAGEQYTSPWLYGSWGEGLNAMAARFHAHVRAVHAGRAPAPVLANTWEATYFHQNMDSFAALATAAAGVGVELFVVDDGWFGLRDDDTSSLGDWSVDARKWPEGLRPLSDLVHQLGMQFGLWVEPEMVSLDSDLARAHPDWVFDAGHGPGIASRNQHVLDLTNPQAYAWISARLHALVDELSIDYFKWDHNRPVLDAGRQGAGGRPGVRGQTLATYRLMRELRDAHPGLRIESCSAGGGRIDLGVLDICDRVWTSDNNDPMERLRIQPWTALLLPPEVMGCHIGAARAHVTGRMTDLSLRAHVALWGNLGLELDVTTLDEAARAEIAQWISVHKGWRPVLHSGSFVSGDRSDGTVLWGVVSPDGAQAHYVLARQQTSACALPQPIALPGLTPGRSYDVEVWSAQGSFEFPALPGALLTRAGFPTPPLNPGESRLVSAVGR